MKSMYHRIPPTLGRLTTHPPTSYPLPDWPSLVEFFDFNFLNHHWGWGGGGAESEGLQPSNTMSIEIVLPSTIGWLSFGGVYQINEFIAVKSVHAGEEEMADHINEQAIFTKLESHPPCPYLVQSFYRVPKETFLELLPNGDLAAVLRGKQTLHPKTYQVLGVESIQPVELSCRWMRQLSAGAVWLEEIGLAHCDIRPANVLLDSKNNAKLADFGRSVKVGEPVEGGTVPFARLLSKDEGPDRGSYGKAGPRTETFAIGSVFYSLTRGYDAYETEWFGKEHGPILLEKFQKKEYPPTTDSVIDTIIRKCWDGEFVSVKSLAEELMPLDVEKQEPVREEGAEWLAARRAECEEMIKSGLLDTLIRKP